MESRRVTKTLEDQWMVEHQVREIYDFFYSIPPNSQSVILELQRDKHFDYLTRGLRKLGPSFSVLDANRPWLCYWILHSIALLGESIDAKLENDAIDFLSRCQDKDGGYGGGPGQMPHLATTYAAVNSLITLGCPKALSSINREKLYAFLLRMKDTSGGFRMHDGGEVDVRACYTAISVASILKIVDDELINGVGNYILSCQTYEGGIAGEPGSEAHGGYTFCGLAAMILINETNRLDLPRLIDWVVFRQGVEGGFQGRTNKLVDGCYSFWQGAVAFLIQRLKSIVHEQLGLSNELSTESADDSSESELSDEEEHLEGTSSHVQKTCPLRQEGQENASDPTKIADTGYDFVNRRIAMRPVFDSFYLQQYVLLCSQGKEISRFKIFYIRSCDSPLGWIRLGMKIFGRRWLWPLWITRCEKRGLDGSGTCEGEAQMPRSGGVSGWPWRVREEGEGGLWGEVIMRDMAWLQISENMALDRKVWRSSIRVLG